MSTAPVLFQAVMSPVRINDFGYDILLSGNAKRALLQTVTRLRNDKYYHAPHCGLGLMQAWWISKNGTSVLGSIQGALHIVIYQLFPL